MAKVAFIGLGVMGYPMAGHLKAKGHEVTVYNRTAKRAEEWKSQHGGSTAPTPREAGKIGALVTSSPKRCPVMSDVPTTVEAGFPNSDYNFWLGTLVAAVYRLDLVGAGHPLEVLEVGSHDAGGLGLCGVRHGVTRREERTGGS